MKRQFCRTLTLLTVFISGTLSLMAQPGNTELMNAIRSVDGNFDALDHRLDVLEKKIDDLLWFDRVGDVAYVDKIYITGPPPAKESNPTGQGAGNPLEILELCIHPA